MEHHLYDTDEQIKEAKNLYNGLIELIKTVLGENAFYSKSSQRKKFNGAVYDSIIIPFSYYPKKSILHHADEIRKEIEKLKSEDEEYNNMVYVGSNAGNKIRTRINAIMSVLHIAGSFEPYN